MSVFRKLKQLPSLARRFGKQLQNAEQQSLLLGKLLAESVKGKTEIRHLGEVEFKVFSQFGDDGIIQWLTHHVDIPNKTFAEFGVEDYRESNTRFLMMNDNWSGIVIDGSPKNVSRIVESEYFWRHDLTAKCAFIDADNINQLLATPTLGSEPGLLHIDLDGNDYWIWKKLELRPVLLVLEYNSVFGFERSITVPYDPGFYRSAAHHSNLYYGASLRSLYELSANKGYAFIGCNSAGNNAYFVRRDKLNSVVTEVSLERGYVMSKYRESRNQNGHLTYLSGVDRLAAIRGLPVYNVATGVVEAL